MMRVRAMMIYERVNRLKQLGGCAVLWYPPTYLPTNIVLGCYAHCIAHRSESGIGD